MNSNVEYYVMREDTAVKGRYVHVVTRCFYSDAIDYIKNKTSPVEGCKYFIFQIKAKAERVPNPVKITEYR